VVRGAVGVRFVDGVLGGRLEAGVVVEEVRFVGVDVPVRGAGYLRGQAGVGECVVEVAGLAVEHVGVGVGALVVGDSARNLCTSEPT
jgi:hypothetical protein